VKKIGMTSLYTVLLTAASGAVDYSPSHSSLTSLSFAAAVPNGVRVTYVGNSGFLIQVGGRKFLLDPLAEEGKEALANARPPYDEVDLILITHNHGDHFDIPTIRQHLKTNARARLVSTAQVTGQLADFSDRTITLTATRENPVQTEVGGIKIKAIYLSHGTPRDGREETINFAYLVGAEGFHLFHTGDIAMSLVDMTAPLSPDKRIDLAFVGHYFLDADPREQQFVKEWVNARYVIASHLKFSRPEFNPERVQQIKSLYPELVILDKESQSWDMPR
jgi:L-ascorbate metabolism protein UlaG (beta-lactamase superfamily)